MPDTPSSMTYTFQVVTAFATLTVIGQVLSVILLLTLLWETLAKRAPGRLTRWISGNALVLMLITAALATGGSLFFSDIAGWTPCKLCWFQRIFIYPQVILLLVALWRRDRGIASSILTLSLIGLPIALYHYSEQVNLALHPQETGAPCDATGVSCAHTPTFAFGYITLPVMAATMLLLNILGSWAMLRRKA